MFEFNPPLRVERNYFRKALIKTKFLREFCHVFVKIKINICEKFRGNLRRNVFAKIQAGINSPQLYSTYSLLLLIPSVYGAKLKKRAHPPSH